VFDAPLRAAVRARLETGTELRFALERRQLDVHYQPIVALSDGMIVGVEALLRWRHPSRGLLGPDQFLSVAEETGLILPIGDWVLRTALRELAIRRQGSASLTVSVNVSGRQLRDGALVDSVRAALDESGLPGAALCLDLTETALAEDPDLTAAALAALRDLGVVICIEDFGTGHSGLGYLKRFPISMVKIHRDLVAGLGHNRDDATIVSAVAAMAHALGLSVVGEGVESEMQESELRRLGCDLGQGLRYAAPGPAARVGRRLRSDLGSDPGIRPPYLAAAMPSPTRGLGTSAAASWTTQ
jgi:EAL domain-containing protein (putative c-di-GMP-specific phosphodiesterase class I)